MYQNVICKFNLNLTFHIMFLFPPLPIFQTVTLKKCVRKGVVHLGVLWKNMALIWAEHII